MSNSLVLFNDHGLLNEPLDVNEVAKLSEDDQLVLAEILPIIRDGEAHDAAVIKTRKALYEAVEVETAATEEDQRVNIATTPVEAVRVWQAATNPDLPKPKPRRIDKKVRAAKEAASLATITLRQEFNQQLKRQREISSPAKAAAIIRWIKVQASPEGRAFDLAKGYRDQGSAQRAENMAHHNSPENPRAPQQIKLKHRGYNGPLTPVPKLGIKY